MDFKWLDNLQSITEGKGAGECPYCHSSNTDYAFTITDPINHMGQGDIWCNDCKKAFRITKAKFGIDTPKKEVPKDLQYDDSLGSMML